MNVKSCRSRLQGLAWMGCCLAHLACVDGSSDGPRVEDCASLAELASLPSRQCREDTQALAFEHSLWGLIEDDAAELLVRVEFGDEARVRSVCADGVSGASEWKARRALGARLAEVMAAPAGPPCLAGRRLDLNRRVAKVAEADRAEFRCRERFRNTRELARGYRDLRFAASELEDCIQHAATWIYVYRSGVMRPLVFGKPETADPPAVRARDTASRCSRENDVDAEIACIESEGWELLH